MRYLHTICTALLLSMLLTSCFTNRTEQSRYYTLLADQQELPAELRDLPQIESALYVRDARVQEAYNRRQMVSRVDATQIRYLQSHLWASNLNRGTADFLAQRALQTNIFTSVEREARIPLPRFEIQMQIDKLEIVPETQGASAAVQTRISLLNRNENRLLYTHTKDSLIAMDSHSPSIFSLEFQNHMYSHVDFFLTSILGILYEED